MSVSDSMGRFIEVNVPAACNSDMELWMIGSISDKCIIRPYVSVTDSSLNLRYDVTDCECFKDSLKTKSLSASMIKKLIIGLNAASKVMSGHLMGEENLLLEPDSIFVDKYDGELRFCAFPFSEINLSEKLEMLMRELLILVDPNDEEAVMLSASLLRTSCFSDCHIYDLMTVLANTAQRENDGGLIAPLSQRLLPLSEDGHDLSEGYNAAGISADMDYKPKNDVNYPDESEDTLYQGRNRKLKNGIADSITNIRKRENDLKDILNRGSKRDAGFENASGQGRKQENGLKDSSNRTRNSETGFRNLLGQGSKQDKGLRDTFEQGLQYEDDNLNNGCRIKRGSPAETGEYKTRFGLKDLDDVSYDIDDILSSPVNGAMDDDISSMDNNGLYAAYANGKGATAGGVSGMGNNELYTAYANGSEKRLNHMHGSGSGNLDRGMPDDGIKNNRQELRKKIVSRIIMSQCMMMAAMTCILLIKGLNAAVRALPVYAIMSVCTALYFAIELFTSRKTAQ